MTKQIRLKYYFNDKISCSYDECHGESWDVSAVRFEQCNGASFSVSHRASLKILAFAASDSPKSSIKVAYPERNRMEKKPIVTV